MKSPNGGSPAVFTPNRQQELKNDEFKAIRDLVYENFGINLTEQKRSLVIGRLQKVLRRREFSTFREYIDFLKADSSGRGLEELANRISTNHTFFNRENQHFEFFSKTILGETVARHKKNKDKDIRIWCAGCSSGEEPYMLVMLMKEFFGAEYRQWRAGLLATDLSAKILRIAMAGKYDDERLQKLPPALKIKYFDKQANEFWQVKEDVRKEILYRRHNLMDSEFPFKKQFDVIFCRNVMIYFDVPTRKALVDKLVKCTAPGGYLFIGHSESLGREKCPYEYVMPAVYRKAEQS